MGFVGSIWLGAAILTGRTAYPRWFVLANPVLVHALLFASYILAPDPVSTLLLPATASLSLLILFGFSTALLSEWRPRTQRGGQTTFATDAGRWPYRSPIACPASRKPFVGTRRPRKRKAMVHSFISAVIVGRRSQRSAPRSLRRGSRRRKSGQNSVQRFAAS